MLRAHVVVWGLIGAVIVGASARAQPAATLVADLNTTPNTSGGGTRGSQPTNFHVVGDRLLFTTREDFTWVCVTDGVSIGRIGIASGVDLTAIVEIAGNRWCAFGSGPALLLIDPDVVVPPNSPDPSLPILTILASNLNMSVSGVAALEGGRTLVIAGYNPLSPSRLLAFDTVTGVQTPLWTGSQAGVAITMGESGGRVYFLDGGVYSTDGRTVVQEFNAPPYGNPIRLQQPIVLANSRLVFLDYNSFVRSVNLTDHSIETLAYLYTPNGKLLALDPAHVAITSDPFPSLTHNFFTSDGTLQGTFEHPQTQLAWTPARPTITRIGSMIAYLTGPSQSTSGGLAAAPIDGPSGALLGTWFSNLDNGGGYPRPSALRGRVLALMPHNHDLNVESYSLAGGPMQQVYSFPAGPATGPFGVTRGFTDTAGVHDGRMYVMAYPLGNTPGAVWTFTGNPAGNRVIATIPVGVQGVRSEYAFAAGRLFFAATDGVHGDELWSVPLPPACPGDFDGDETVAVADILAMIGAFFAGDLAADADGNGVLAVADVFRFLNDWFAGCS